MWKTFFCQQKLPICCKNNNELHSTNPSNARKQKTKCGSWNKVRPETKRASWNRVHPERVRRGRLRRVGKILETRGNFDEVSEIKNQRFFRSNVFKAMFVNISADEDDKSELVRKWRVRRRQIRKGRLYHSPICCEIENLINDFIGVPLWWWEKLRRSLKQVEEKTSKSLDSCQMHKNFQSKIHSCWSLGNWWDFEKN